MVSCCYTSTLRFTYCELSPPASVSMRLEDMDECHWPCYEKRVTVDGANYREALKEK